VQDGVAVRRAGRAVVEHVRLRTVVRRRDDWADVALQGRFQPVAGLGVLKHRAVGPVRAVVVGDVRARHAGDGGENDQRRRERRCPARHPVTVERRGRRGGAPVERRQPDRRRHGKREHRVDRRPRCSDVGRDRVAQDARETPVGRERDGVAPPAVGGVAVDDEAHHSEDDDGGRAVHQRLEVVVDVREVRVRLVRAAEPRPGELRPRPDRRLAGDARQLRGRPERGPQRGPGRVEEDDDGEEDDEPPADGERRERHAASRRPAPRAQAAAERVDPRADHPSERLAPRRSLDESVVDQERPRAGETEDVDERVLLRGERERERDGAEDSERHPACVERPDDEGERGDGEAPRARRCA
jgi:hypothetical protein